MSPIIKPYDPNDKAACLAIFRDNVPEYFHPQEEQDFINFLQQNPPHYFTLRQDKQVCGCFGVTEIEQGNSGKISWVMLATDMQGSGLGRTIMEHCINTARNHQLRELKIAASHKSESYFAKFGALRRSHTPDGWGEGMHRVDMILRLEDSPI